MHHVLLIVEKPKLNDGGIYAKWVDCTTDLLSLTNSNKDIVPLGENCLLLPLHHGLESLAEVVQYLRRLKYRYIIFDEKPILYEGPTDD